MVLGIGSSRAILNRLTTCNPCVRKKGDAEALNMFVLHIRKYMSPTSAAELAIIDK